MQPPAMPRLVVLRFLSALLAGLSCFSQAAEIEERGAVIISDGVRLAAELYDPKSASQALPTIIMSHGWGGTAAMLAPQATDFAQAGYFVIVFDYRGWGKSRARVIQTAPAAAEKSADGRFTGEMRELRELVDPLDQAMDMQNVIHWAMGEGAVDKSRVGLWGTSFSGGLVVYVAARDPRVRALVSQVGYMGQPVDSAPAGALSSARVCSRPW